MRGKRMKKKSSRGIMLLMLLMNMLALTFDTKLVKTEDIPEDISIGAYYYVWWGMDVNPHWPLGYKYTPVLGEYTSASPEVADQHILWAVKYGIDFFAISWFGSHEWADYPAVDQSLRDGFLKADYLPNIHFAIFYESATIMNRAESLGANKTQIFIEDMLYIATNYFNNPSYFKINNKPVVFLHALYYLYQKFDYSTLPFDFVRKQLDMNIYFVGDAVVPSTPNVSLPVLQAMDAVTSYFFKFSTDWQTILNDMETYYPQWLSAMNSIGVNFIPNAYPGFDDTEFLYGANRVLPRNQSIFRKVLDMVSKYLDPYLKTLIITSWNEWHESTSIEPAVEWGEIYLQCLQPITATIDVDPNTINLKSNGEWITVYIELPNDYNVSNIDINTVFLNETFSIDVDAPIQVGDYDADDIPDLMVKFDRATLIDWLGTFDFSEDTGKNIEVALIITGEVAGTFFEGSDTVKVLLKG
jgi:hypothetical protein